MHRAQRITCGGYPLVRAGSLKCLNTAAMAGEQRSEHSITTLGEAACEQRKRLGRISKTMQEENSV
jgi:hypothetical protein